jgi:hypothetical protein
VTAPVAVPLFPWHVDPPYAGRGRRPRAQAAVLMAVRGSAGGTTVAALAVATGRSPANVRRCLRALARSGLVTVAARAERGKAWSAQRHLTCVIKPRS